MVAPDPLFGGQCVQYSLCGLGCYLSTLHLDSRLYNNRLDSTVVYCVSCLKTWGRTQTIWLKSMSFTLKRSLFSNFYSRLHPTYIALQCTVCWEWTRVHERSCIIQLITRKRKRQSDWGPKRPLHRPNWSGLVRTTPSGSNQWSVSATTTLSGVTAELPTIPAQFNTAFPTAVIRPPHVPHVGHA